jgi:hypothetical protein
MRLQRTSATPFGVVAYTSHAYEWPDAEQVATHDRPPNPKPVSSLISISPSSHGTAPSVACAETHSKEMQQPCKSRVVATVKAIPRIVPPHETAYPRRLVRDAHVTGSVRTQQRQLGDDRALRASLGGLDATAKAAAGSRSTKPAKLGVRRAGLEPAHHYWRQNLNLVRLPIPPPSRRKTPPVTDAHEGAPLTSGSGSFSTTPGSAEAGTCAARRAMLPAP